LRLQTARRRESRTVQAARAAVEEERLARLQALHRLLQHAQTLEVDERARLLADFERDTSTSRRVSTVTVAVPRTTPVLPPRSRSEEISWGQYHAIERDIIDDLWGAPHARPADVKTAAPNVPELVSSPTPPVDVTSVVEEPVSPLRALGRALKQLALVPLQALTSEQPKGAQPSDLVSAFTHLFTRFQRSVPEASAAAADEAAAAATPEDAQALHTISKHQKALTDAEDAVWRTLAAEDADYAGLAADVAALLDRSAALTESYGRRTNVPTAATYAEAREVLGALGVQCVVPAGACEAEALAAALVLHGHADYVVSEDTVRTPGEDAHARC
jgi:flap endonuclease-1